jgi:two-component system, cell cycle sensor histidine kinase and response regulator CckA
VRARHSGARLLFMSGYTEEAALKRSVLDPSEAFLSKPFTPDALTRKVREVLDRPAGARAPDDAYPPSPSRVRRS